MKNYLHEWMEFEMHLFIIHLCTGMFIKAMINNYWYAERLEWENIDWKCPLAICYETYSIIYTFESKAIEWN